MARHAVVVIGASAGGLQALSTIVERLPASLPASVVVVVHSSGTDGVLPTILKRVSALPVGFARHGDSLQPGHIYVAPGDFHAILQGRRIGLVHGPRENGFRPAIDPLFRTAAREFGADAIGVILSGALSDGTYGLSAIKHHGGVCIVQDPGEAMVPSMPQAAIRGVAVDHVLPATGIADAILRLAGHRSNGQEEQVMARNKTLEPQQVKEETEISDMEGLFGAPSALTCPDCGGALWQVQEGGVLRYQCHVGHQYAPENLEAAQRDVIDGALWSAVRVLEEHAELKLRMAQRAAEGGLKAVSQGFSEGARDAHDQATRIRSVLLGLGNGQGEKNQKADRKRKRVDARSAAAKRSRGGIRPRRGRAGRA